jgi:plasmid maintenance system killer protein
LKQILFIAIFFFLLALPATAQVYKIRGTVYDSSRNYPVELVSVLSSSGNGTVTNAEGYYEIEVQEKDSIWFSYLNKPTMKFAVLKIVNPMAFDISIQINIPLLKEVKIKPKNYRLDSLQNRLDYAKIFNYQKPKIKTVTPQYGAGMGFDLDEIINIFRFRRNKSIAAFQQRLIQEEREKYVNFRYNKALVRRLTMLEGNLLDSFMRVFRPSYLFTSMAGDYEFQYYIRESLYRFKKGLQPLDLFKQEIEE